MTITQKIISQNEMRELSLFDIDGSSLVPPFVFTQSSDVFGAGALVCVCATDKDIAKKNPAAVRVQLDGAPKDDFDVCEFIPRLLQVLNTCGTDIGNKSVEFGGDSLSYLYVEERYKIAKALFGKCANCIFEADYLTVEYLRQRGATTLPVYFADGEWDYEKVITVNL